MFIPMSNATAANIANPFQGVRAMPSRSSLLSLRGRFAGLRDGSHKQIGLRSIRDALALLGRNDAAAAELAARASFHLPYAEAAR